MRNRAPAAPGGLTCAKDFQEKRVFKQGASTEPKLADFLHTYMYGSCPPKRKRQLERSGLENGGMSRSHITSATMNVCGNPAMRQPQVKHDVRKAAQHADLIGWQEMSRDRYLNAIKQLDPGGVHRMPGHSQEIYAGKHWSHYMPTVGGGKHQSNVEVPISWNNDKFKFENKPGNCGTLLLNKGTHKPGFNNPNRYATWVKLTDRKTGETFIRLNAHFANGAFNKAKNYHQWRMNAWKEDQQKLKDLVGQFQKQGLPVIVGGDLNIPHGRPLGNQVRYDAPRSLDYMMHTPNRHLHSDHGHVVHGFASDHDEVVAGYTLTQGKIKG